LPWVFDDSSVPPVTLTMTPFTIKANQEVVHGGGVVPERLPFFDDVHPAARREHLVDRRPHAQIRHELRDVRIASHQVPPNGQMCQPNQWDEPERVGRHQRDV
jgi:hypothetical protein